MSVSLTLRDRHTAAGATFEPHGEREMVSHYGDAAAEARAARAGAGLIDWGGGTRLRVTHTGTRTAHDFLEGILSNAVPTPPTDAGCYATLLTNAGKIVADCRVWPRTEAEGILLATESASGSALRDTLAKYGFLDDVAVADVSDAFGMLGLYGPRSAELFEAAFGSPLPGLEPDTLVEVDTGPGALLVARSAATGDAGFDLLADAERLVAAWDLLREAGAAPLGLAAFHTLRVEAGVPWVGAELDERVLPNQVSLERAVSYAKGCFVGQEAVAKLHYRGRSPIGLVGLTMGDIAPPATDTPVQIDGEDAGRITTAVVSPTLGRTIALAICKVSRATPGTAVTVDGAAGSVVTLPFHVPGDGSEQYPEADIRDGAAPPA